MAQMRPRTKNSQSAGLSRRSAKKKDRDKVLEAAWRSSGRRRISFGEWMQMREPILTNILWYFSSPLAANRRSSGKFILHKLSYGLNIFMCRRFFGKSGLHQKIILGPFCRFPYQRDIDCIDIFWCLCWKPYLIIWWRSCCNSFKYQEARSPSCTWKRTNESECRLNNWRKG